MASGAPGRAVIRGEEIDRFELALGAHAGAHYTGHVRAGEALAPLPAGSQLDATTGAFTWAPGVGLIGRYDLVFVRWEGTRAVARHEVRVILAPKGSGHVGVQVVIDTPRSQQDVAQPFLSAGGRRTSAPRGHRHRDAARLGISADGRTAGLPRRDCLRRRAAGCRGGPRRRVPRVRLRPVGAGPQPWALRSGRVRLEHRAGQLRARPDRARDRASIERYTQRFSRPRSIVRTHPARRLLRFAIQEVPRWEDARFGMRAHKESTLCVRAVEV